LSVRPRNPMLGGGSKSEAIVPNSNFAVS
jgi:hypothetical protein